MSYSRIAEDAGGPVLATFSIHTARAASRRPSVVVMQAIEDGECYDPTVSLGQSRQRVFLPEALVWPRLVVEAGVLRDDAQKLALAKHEEMVEQFTPERADKALGEGVHVRGPDRGANDLGADSFEQAREPSTQLGVAIDDKHFGLDVQGCVSRLLRTPVIGRRPGDCSMHDSPSLQIEKEQDEDRAEEHVEGLHEVTSPGNVVAEESTPAVAVAGHPLLHVPLHGALRDPDSKLEQLTSKPLGAPPWVSRRHLADQRRVACGPSAARSWPPSPQKAEALPVPPKHSGRLHQRHRRPPRSRASRQERDRQALRAREHHALALQPTLRSRQLLSEKLVLCNKRCARTELPHHQPHESAEHRGRVSRGEGP